jgi:2-dehydropantoate 2-reductase
MGDFTVHPAQASGDPTQVGEVDVVLLAVKTWQVPEAALSMQPVVGSKTCVLPLENGVEAPSQLAAALGIERVLGGMCQISSAIAGPGHIRHVGIDPYIAFGELDGRPSERVERLLRTFQKAEGMRVEAVNDIQAAMWRKFLFIAAISGVGAVARAPAGVIRSLPETRRLLELAMQEVHAIARARSIRLPEDVVVQTLAFIDHMGPGVIASMHRDILNGRPSELEAQNGAVVRMGLEAGVPTPVHEYLFASLLPQELKARGKVDF